MRRSLVLAALAVLAACGIVGGLIIAGQYLRESVKDEPRYQFPFSEIECPAPPGLTREAFLGEVRYLAEFPEQVSLVDDGLPMRLSAAFARHAWVERADRIEVGPGRSIRVRLTFRTPVLAVTIADRDKTTRAVDGSGVLLPKTAEVNGLPRLAGTAKAPVAGPGHRWGDPRVEGAAQVAGLLHPHRELFQLWLVEWRDGEVWVRRDATHAGPLAIWGHPPGAEIEGETSAKQKLERLIGYCEKHGGLDRPNPQVVHDVRTLEK